MSRSLGWSSGAQAITPDVYLWSNSSDVGHRGHGVRIAAQDRHVLPDLALAVQLARQVVSRGLARARAVGEELNQHRPRPARAAAARSRSMATR